jgi:propanol-preferring alcohol dehydrogenase
MRALRLHTQALIGKEPLRLEECAAPEPGPGELRLTVKACGVCRTDLHIAEGDLPLVRKPLIPGHQIVGEIEAVGPGVDERRIGERVGITWMSSACGSCDLCESGRENLCAEARFTGYHVDGGYAESVVVPQGAAHPLPQALGDAEVAPLLCAGVIGYRSLRLSEVQPGQRLGLYGFGASAHLAIQVARHWDCEVFVFTRAAHHRELAKRLGAAWVGGAKSEAPARLHAAVIFAPAGWIVREALRALRPGGTVAINAIHMDPIPELDYREHLYGERTLRSVTNLTHRDAQELLELAAEIPIEARVETFELEDANRVLLAMKESKLEAAAALVP